MVPVLVPVLEGEVVGKHLIESVVVAKGSIKWEILQMNLETFSRSLRSRQFFFVKDGSFCWPDDH